MQDYEKLGAFYLGRQYDLEAKQPLDDLVLYDAKDLTTHAVCVGMTGSGKTGLCLDLLEEAAIDGIPAIAIDPKGDLGNLLLTFPELRPEDFRPWIDPAEATRRGQSPDEFAAATAKTWREGLAAWGQPERIAKFRSAADVAIYTPGSNAGLPLTVVRSFSAPGQAVLNDADALRERISATTSGLLALLGVDADPLRSREHILVASLLEASWRAGQDLDLAGLIRGIQAPPFTQVGFMDLETFYPAKHRFELATTLNGLLASPSFGAWLAGEPLDVQRLFYTAEGKPRLSIISIAHLSDAERMFFVTILLNEVVAWMRAQSGTSSLRALLYMDEVFGYFPPTANPPSKGPMLTLMKQARAFGLGVVLATQNPVDLDYKGLSNAGTWFLGRLQTERDKARVLDGLEGASAAAGAQFDRQLTERILSGLGSRVFLMNNVHEDHPVVFQSRWALSYLRGPLTRDQIQTLMQGRKSAATPTSSPAAPAAAVSVAVAAAAANGAGPRPVLPPDVAEGFVPSRARAGAAQSYQPCVLGVARVHFVQAKDGIDAWENLILTAPADGAEGTDPWQDSESANEEPELLASPEEGIPFAALPGELARAKKYASLGTALKDHVYRSHKLNLFRCAALKQISQPEEREGDFRVRLGQLAREQRDVLVEKLRAKYGPKLASLAEQKRKALQRVEKEKSQANQTTMQAVISFGSSVLGALFGRKLRSSVNVGRAASAARAAGRVARDRADIGLAEESVEAIDKRIADLEAQSQAEIAEVQAAWDVDRLAVEPLPLQPKKADISVTRVQLIWRPEPA